MSDVLPNRSFPRFTFLLAAVSITLALALAVAGRITGPVSSEITAAPSAVRELRFVDRDDGGVAIQDAADGTTISVAAPGTNGFLRATLRGLARARIMRDAGPQTPFRLTRWQDGRLTLEDPDTGRRVELEAFGATNSEVFAALLTAKAAP